MKIIHPIRDSVALNFGKGHSRTIEDNVFRCFRLTIYKVNKQKSTYSGKKFNTVETRDCLVKVTTINFDEMWTVLRQKESNVES